jgi:hypothetical protein
MQSVYQWEKTADYLAISWGLAAFSRILVRNPPGCVGNILPKPGEFSGARPDSDYFYGHKYGYIYKYIEDQMAR